MGCRNQSIGAKAGAAASGCKRVLLQLTPCMLPACPCHTMPVPASLRVSLDLSTQAEMAAGGGAEAYSSCEAPSHASTDSTPFTHCRRPCSAHVCALAC